MNSDNFLFVVCKKKSLKRKNSKNSSLKLPKVTQSYFITATQSYPIAATQSYPITVTQSYPITVTQSYPITATQSYPIKIPYNSHPKFPYNSHQSYPIKLPYNSHPKLPYKVTGNLWLIRLSHNCPRSSGINKHPRILSNCTKLH